MSVFPYDKIQNRTSNTWLSKNCIFFLILFCNAAFTNAQTASEANKEVDSLLALPIDSVLSWMRSEQNTNIDTYQKIGLTVLKRALKHEDVLKIAEVHEEMANWYGYHGIFPQDSTIYHGEKSLEYYKLTGNKKKIAATYRTLAIDYLRKNSQRTSQEFLFKALEIYEELDDEQGMAAVYRVLGVLLGEMDKPLESIKYAKQAINLFKKANDHTSIAVAHFDLIKGYIRLGQFDNAYQAADNCINIVKTKAQDEVFVLVRAYSYRGDVSIATKDYDQALKDYTKAWELCVAEIGEERSATYRTEIGNTYRLQGKYGLALENLLIGIKAYEDDENERIWPLYEQIADCYRNLNNSEMALYYFEKSRKIRDKIHEEQIANLESEALIKYETGKKDEALAAQSILLEQKTRVQNLSMAIGALLLVLLGLVFFFLRRSRKANVLILAKNAENELLLKEIHHRVKNNLEMVKSLISLQSAQLEDSATKDAMIASQNRVQSMGIIHQKLYQGTNLGSIEMRDYFMNLGEGILDTFNAEDKVKITCAMDNLELDVDTAVPIGLIVNELLTNALKYAFPENTKGQIEIILSRTDSRTLRLKVTDNGIGKISDQPAKGTGFGTQLIQLLTQQLNGSIQEEIGKGTTVSFEFKMDRAA
ncbi:sensor histidine kinase [Maribacter algicola]|nr:histidine kinase dimerization/phosphoacceptor domain -containing protein [Maribacter algicola]